MTIARRPELKGGYKAAMLLLLALSGVSFSMGGLVDQATASSLPSVSLWSEAYQGSVIDDEGLVPGSVFSLMVRIQDAFTIMGYEFTLFFNGTLLKVESVDFTGTIFRCEVASRCSTVREARFGPGSLYVAVSSLPDNPPAGSLALIVFRVQAYGSTLLSLRNTALFHPFPSTFITFLGDVDGIFSNAPRDPAIAIVSDNDFTLDNGVVSGSGTAEDPYVIEDLSINAAIDWVPVTFPTGTWRASILIANTTAHLIIRDVQIHDGGDPNLGIVLRNATNVVIESPRVSNGNTGVFLVATRDSMVTFGEFYNLRRGIVIWGGPYPGKTSTGNFVTENSVHDNEFGIHLVNASVNVVRSNNISRAVWAIQAQWSSSGNMFTKNHVSDSIVGVQVFQDSNNNTISHNRIAITQLFQRIAGLDPIVGISIGRNVWGTIVTHNVAGGFPRGIGLGDAFDTVVSYNKIEATEVGVRITLLSDRNRIAGNIITAPVGIFLCSVGGNSLGPPPNDLSQTDKRMQHCPGPFSR